MAQQVPTATLTQNREKYLIRDKEYGCTCIFGIRYDRVYRDLLVGGPISSVEVVLELLTKWPIAEECVSQYTAFYSNMDKKPQHFKMHIPCSDEQYNQVLKILDEIGFFRTAVYKFGRLMS